MTAIGQAFVERSRAYLSSEYLPKIRRSLQEIQEEDLWWRPSSQANSIGNLLLHLNGNVRQWVVSGIGGEADVRERQQEFDAEGGKNRQDLLALLERTLRDVDHVLERLDGERLSDRRVIQGQDVSVLEALYHAVEHFAMHTGQIIYITKLRTSRDLGFYEIRGGNPRATW